MTKREAQRQTAQENGLRALGFSQAEAEQLRRISNRLHRWYEKECGVDNGCIERDEERRALLAQQRQRSKGSHGRSRARR
jgi:hypothetical protein